ncbi:MAG TPA: peptidoglycan DD-metalloendopeptidase family protein [Myxococcota bacterium]|nr:peptidoglycan DD-metalloendopeptidase family protein [Myxococcota bacterium]
MQYRGLYLALLASVLTVPVVGIAARTRAPLPPAAKPELVTPLLLPSESVPGLLGWADFANLPLAEQPAVPVAAPAEGPSASAPGAVAAVPRIVTGTIASGTSVAVALRRAGLTPATVDLLTREMASVFDFRRSHPGDRYTIVRGRSGGVAELAYESVTHEKYRVFREGSRLVAEKKGGDFVRRTARLGGIISSNLYDVIQDLGEAPTLAHDFADIFAYDVDFARGMQRGDEFQILYERLYRTDARGHEHYVRPGRILAAHYASASGDHNAIYYQTDPGHGGYYRPDGTPVRRSFLAAPLQYTRVSSAFSRARFHPILKYTRPHPGIDYAAPLGTPLWAVGDGKVMEMGWAGGYGQLIKIQHEGGYASYYGHLSRFAKGLHVGSMVRQKQVIGYVGQTGLATGPHVCFRITKDGEYVNPAQMPGRTVALGSVGGDKDFRSARETLLAGLRSSQFVAVDDAL